MDVQELSDRVAQYKPHWIKRMYPTIHDACDAVMQTMPERLPGDLLAWSDRAMDYYRHAGHEEMPGHDVAWQRQLIRFAIGVVDYSDAVAPSVNA